MKKYKIEKSLFPEDNNTHLVFVYSESKHGYNIERIFKGTRKECENFINEKRNK